MESERRNVLCTRNGLRLVVRNLTALWHGANVYTVPHVVVILEPN